MRVCFCQSACMRCRCGVSSAGFINREPELQMLPSLLRCDIPIHFDVGPLIILHEKNKKRKPRCFRQLLPD